MIIATLTILGLMLVLAGAALIIASAIEWLFNGCDGEE